LTEVILRHTGGSTKIVPSFGGEDATVQQHFQAAYTTAYVCHAFVVVPDVETREKPRGR
jgi:hypothetical protein